MENKIEMLNCSDNPNLKSDFLLYLNLKKISDLWLGDNLEVELVKHKRVWERIGDLSSVKRKNKNNCKNKIKNINFIGQNWRWLF